LFLRKGKKIRRKNRSIGVLRALRGPRGPLGAKKEALLSPIGAQVAQEDRTMSNCCIKERKEEEKNEGP
jgi:hypothetical protein